MSHDARRTISLVSLLACAAVLALLLSPTARATQAHVFSSSFGSPGSEAGQVLLQGANGGEHGGSGVAVDSLTHDVYVADTGNHRVDEFEADGTFLRAWGWGVADGASEFETCTLVCQQGIAGSAPGQSEEPLFVAVDNSGGASEGDVYVGDPGDGLLAKFDAAGNPVSDWGVQGQLDGSTTSAGSFGSLAGVAVASSGALYVTNREKALYVFDQGGKLEAEYALVRETYAHGLALDSSGDVFKVNGDESVEEFTALGEDVGQVSPNSGEGEIARGIATDGSDLYSVENGLVRRYSFLAPGIVAEPGGTSCTVAAHAPCPATDSFGSSAPAGGALSEATSLAVDGSTGNAYVADAGSNRIDAFAAIPQPSATTQAAGEVQATRAQLNATVNPEGVAVTACEFEYVDAADYEQSSEEPYAKGGRLACAESPAQIGSGTTPVPVHAELAGLTAGTVYHYRVRAANAQDEALGPQASAYGQDATFETLPPPQILDTSVSSLRVVASGSVSGALKARIDPRGAETAYRFEYGTSATEEKVPASGGEGHVSAGAVPVEVSAQLEGLQANRTYHWRIALENANGTVASPDKTFVYDTSGEGLPDGRAYEMVTPPHKNGALLGDVSFLGSLVPFVSEDGDKLIAAAVQCFADATSCNGQRGGDGIGSPYEFSRTGSAWQATALAPAASEFAANTPFGYNATTGDALFTMSTPPSGEDDFYLRKTDGSFLDIGPNTPPELGARGPFGGRAGAHSQVETSDYSHLAWVTEAPAQWPFDEREPSSREAVYEYAGTGNTHPFIVGVTGEEGSTSLVSRCGTSLGLRGSTPRGTMSSDGRTVYFVAAPCASGSGANSGTPVPVMSLYARVDGELPTAHTTAISAPEPSECGAGTDPRELSCREAAAKPSDSAFMGASSDGSKAFFLSTQQLTDEASQDPESADDAVLPGCSQATGAGGCNLYEYDSADSAAHHLIDVSAGDSSGGGPRVQGVMALSPDGSHVYFVAQGVLSTGSNSEGQKAQSGQDNLYLFERDAAFPTGRTVFVATLPSLDAYEWNEIPGLPANVTSDGRFLVFLSHGALTPDATSRSGAQQVFRYDAGSGALTRLSIGANGFNDNGNRSGPTPCDVASGSCAEDALIVQGNGYPRSDPSMADDGKRVFFESPVALVAGALDDVQIEEQQGMPAYALNVYEWEQEGAGGCPSGRPDGCVFLISGGHDVSVNKGGFIGCSFSSVCLIGSDRSGDNVFFATTDQLVGQDTDTELDYYDARVCTAEQPCLDQSATPAPECEGDACQGSPPPSPSVPSASSVTFDGPGNRFGEHPAPVHRAVRVLSHTARNAKLLLTVVVSEAGYIAIAGSGVRAVHRHIARAGTYRFTLLLTRKARAALHRKRGRELTVHLQIRFSRSGGATTVLHTSLKAKA